MEEAEDDGKDEKLGNLETLFLLGAGALAGAETRGRSCKRGLVVLGIEGVGLRGSSICSRGSGLGAGWVASILGRFVLGTVGRDGTAGTAGGKDRGSCC